MPFAKGEMSSERRSALEYKRRENVLSGGSEIESMSVVASLARVGGPREMYV